MVRKNFGSLILCSVLALGVAGCGQKIKTEAKFPTGDTRDKGGENDIYNEQGSIFGQSLKLSGKKNRGGDSDGASGIGVNSFLWRATLDTVSFMPLASADPFGGVILTDWYIDPQITNERVKINAFILGRDLQAANIRVRTFRQILQNGQWVDAAVSEETARKLEDAILTRARELRIAHLGK